MSTASVAIVGWLTSIMLAASPPAKRVLPNDPDREHFIAAETERYEDFARSLAEVVYDPDQTPIFKGTHGRANTAVMMLSVAWYESGFRRDVDLGEGSRSRGDNGRSCTLWQFNLGREGKTREGFTCDDMYDDRTKAALSAYSIVRSSMSMCSGLAPEYRLSAYTAGRCEDGQEQSRSRVLTARRWLQTSPPPMTDDEAIEEAHAEEERAAEADFDGTIIGE